MVFLDMWVFLPIASLLIPTIVGNLEIHNSGLPEKLRPRNENDDPFHNQIKKSSVDKPKVWTTETLPQETGEKQININKMRLKRNDNPNDAQNSRNINHNQDVGSDMKIVSKRSEAVNSWLYLSAKDKDFSKDKKGTRFYPWGGKRIAIYGSGSPIRRPIRVPFNSWGGKRGEDYPDLSTGSVMKRNKLLFERDGQSVNTDGYGVKREIDVGKMGWKIPFNSWGGKRSQEVSDSDEKQLVVIMADDVPSNDEHVMDNSKGDLPDGGSIENTINKKRAARMKSKTRMAFNSWGGKRDGSDYQTLQHVNNETSNDDTSEEDVDDNDWFFQTPNKRAGGQFRKASFNPWGGKRTSKTYALRFENDYSGLPAEYTRGIKAAFFPWGG